MDAMLGLALVSLSLLSAPLASEGFCPAQQANISVFHEWSHDAGYWANGYAPLHPWTVSGDKWGNNPGWQRASAGGLVGETWLAAATRDPCLVHANTTSVGAYTLRALADPHQSGDFDPHRRERNVFGAAALGSALVIEAITAWEQGR